MLYEVITQVALPDLAEEARLQAPLLRQELGEAVNVEPGVIVAGILAVA